MALYEIEKDNSGAPTGNYNLQAGGTLYADSPIGTILAFGGANAPSGWLLCHGQALSRTEYNELFAVIGTAFGAGDGSTTFNLPDLRDRAVMGVDDGGTLGESQDSQNKEHTHTWSNTHNHGITCGDQKDGYSRPFIGGVGSATIVNTANKTISGTTSANGGTDARPKNVRCNFIIKAKMVGVPADFIDKVEEAVSEAITVKKGTWTGNITLEKMGDSQIRDRFDIPVTFDSPMPDNNYTVVIEFFESRYVTVRSASKTAAGFHIEGANCDNNAVSTVTKITWTAIRFPS